MSASARARGPWAIPFWAGPARSPVRPSSLSSLKKLASWVIGKFGNWVIDRLSIIQSITRLPDYSITQLSSSDPIAVAHQRFGTAVPEHAVNIKLVGADHEIDMGRAAVATDLLELFVAHAFAA